MTPVSFLRTFIYALIKKNSDVKEVGCGTSFQIHVLSNWQDLIRQVTD